MEIFDREQHPRAESGVSTPVELKTLLSSSHLETIRSSPLPCTSLPPTLECHDYWGCLHVSVPAWGLPCPRM